MGEAIVVEMLDRVTPEREESRMTPRFLSLLLTKSSPGLGTLRDTCYLVPSGNNPRRPHPFQSMGSQCVPLGGADTHPFSGPRDLCFFLFTPPPSQTPGVAGESFQPRDEGRAGPAVEAAPPHPPAH